MHKIQIPGWATGQRRRSAFQRDLQQEIFEALMGMDAQLLPHSESKWDE